MKIFNSMTSFQPKIKKNSRKNKKNLKTNGMLPCFHIIVIFINDKILTSLNNGMNVKESIYILACRWIKNYLKS